MPSTPPPHSRKTSSPLSSPSSTPEPILPNGPARVNTINGLAGSPATSSTLPLTDDESELTEEEDGEGTRDEEGDVGSDGEEADDPPHIRPQSQASTASLTPPPSDPISSSPSASTPPPPSHVAVSSTSGRDTEHQSEATDSTSHTLPEEKGDADVDIYGSDEPDEDGDVTMRPSGEGDDQGDQESTDPKTANGVTQASEHDGRRVPVMNDGMETDEELIVAPDAEDELDITELAENEPDVNVINEEPLNHGKHPSYAPLPPPATMRELLILEIKLAELRDCLYVEKMEEAASEESMILKGTYPALEYLYGTLEERRGRLHEGAAQRYEAQVAELKRMRDAESHLIWSTWTDQRDRLHWDEFQNNWRQRRKLDREKDLIETAWPPKIVPTRNDLGSVRNFDWSQTAIPPPLSRDVAYVDVLAMNRRAPYYPISRNQSPSTYPPQYTNVGPALPAPPQQQSIPPIPAGANIYTAYNRDPPRQSGSQLLDFVSNSGPR